MKAAAQLVTFALLAAMLAGGAGVACLAASSPSLAHSALPPCHRHLDRSHRAPADHDPSNHDPSNHDCCVRRAPSVLPATVVLPQPALRVDAEIALTLYPAVAAQPVPALITSSTGPPQQLALRI